MKQLIWKLVLPVTVISLATFKWWYVLPVDTPDTMMSGFPLPFVSDGWHTSMSLQIFLTEFLIDFLTYFLFWFILLYGIDRYLITIKVPKILITTLYTLTGLIFVIVVMAASMPEQIIKVKRDWDMQVMQTGYKLTWKYQDRPDIDKYDIREK